MKGEKIILLFFAVFIGLIVAGAAFYLYETSQTVSPATIRTIATISPSPTPGSSLLLSIDSPKDQSVVTNKIITVSGKTDPSATVIVSTATVDSVVSPSATGTFSLTITLPDSENQIRILSIDPSGAENEKTLTIGYQTQDF